MRDRAPSDRERVGELLQRIRALVAELKGAESTGLSRGELREKERALERLRWELADIVRRAASWDGGRPAAAQRGRRGPPRATWLAPQG